MNIYASKRTINENDLAKLSEDKDDNKFLANSKSNYYTLIINAVKQISKGYSKKQGSTKEDYQEALCAFVDKNITSKPDFENGIKTYRATQNMHIVDFKEIDKDGTFALLGESNRLNRLAEL